MSETISTQSFVLGAPRFAAHGSSPSPTDGGALGQWREACRCGVREAAAAIEGDFALALVGDGQAWLAVDRFAIRSLCYRIDHGVLRVAPRADQLADAATPIDPQAVHDYLYFHVIPSPRTIYRGIYRLPAGHCATFRDGKLTVEPYWRPEFVEGEPTFDALRDEFRGLLREAVRRRLDGSRPACFLSGGTDSSTVAGLIGEVAGAPAASYSVGFDAEGYDEMAYARIAAKRFATEHHELYVTPDDLVAHIPRVAAHYDQPFGNSSALPSFLCQQRARDDGVSRMLAGDGGDELFGGNERYAKHRVFGWYHMLPAGLRSSLIEPALGSALGRLPLARKAASYVEQARTPLPDRMQMYNQLRRLGPSDVLTAEFLAAIDLESPPRQQREVWAAACAPGSSQLNRMLAFDWRYTLAENDLPKVCGTAALAGMEVAFPFLDDQLLAFSLRLPSAYKLRGFKLRWFFKEALRGFLPDEIITKPKQGFGLPFGVWLVRHPRLRALADAALDSLAGRGVVRPAFIDSLRSTRMAEHPGYYGGLVWVLMMLEFWLQHHAPSWKLADSR